MHLPWARTQTSINGLLVLRYNIENGLCWWRKFRPQFQYIFDKRLSTEKSSFDGGFIHHKCGYRRVERIQSTYYFFLRSQSKQNFRPLKVPLFWVEMYGLCFSGYLQNFASMVVHPIRPLNWSFEWTNTGLISCHSKQIRLNSSRRYNATQLLTLAMVFLNKMAVPARGSQKIWLFWQKTSVTTKTLRRHFLFPQCKSCAVFYSNFIRWGRWIHPYAPQLAAPFAPDRDQHRFSTNPNRYGTCAAGAEVLSFFCVVFMIFPFKFYANLLPGKQIPSTLWLNFILSWTSTGSETVVVCLKYPIFAGGGLTVYPFFTAYIISF